jgi:hypothetical protein
MAIPQEPEIRSVDAHEVAEFFAEIVRDEPRVQRLWVTSHRGVVRLWLLTEAMESRDELRLYGLLDHVYDHFGAVGVHLHLLSPLYFDPLELDVIVPQGAEEIALRAA